MKKKIHYESAIAVVVFILVCIDGLIRLAYEIIIGFVGYSISFLLNIFTDDDAYTGIGGGFETGGW